MQTQVRGSIPRLVHQTMQIMEWGRCHAAPHTSFPQRFESFGLHLLCLVSHGVSEEVDHSEENIGSNPTPGASFVALARERHIDAEFESQVNVKQMWVQLPTDRKIRADWLPLVKYPK